jgi:hypothetical protein
MTNLITDVANITTRQDGSFARAPFRIPCGSVIHTTPSTYGRKTRQRLMTDSAFARSASRQIRDSAAMDCTLPDSYFMDPEDAIIGQIEPAPEIYERAEPIVRRESRAKARRIVVRSTRGFKALLVETPDEETDSPKIKDTIPSPPPFDLSEILDSFMQPQVAAMFKDDDNAKPTAQAEPEKATIPSHLRQCSCGVLFAPPYNAPDAKMCQKCYRPILKAKLQRRAQAQQPEVVAPVTVRTIESTIRALVQSNRLSELPEGATIKSNDGHQVIVLYGGKSMTIHISQPRKIPNKGHRQSFRR